MTKDRRGATNGEVVGNKRDGTRSKMYKEALVETRNVLDVQHDMTEAADKQILRVLNVNLLILGGIATLIAYLPDLMTQMLPWLVCAGFLILSSITAGSYIYRDTTLYAGFGDHGFDSRDGRRIVPEKKYGYDLIINTPEDRSIPEAPPEREEPPSASEFRASLLREHQAGINHNNCEIKYRTQIHQQITLLSSVGILILGIGIVTVLSGISSIYVTLGSLAVTSIAVLFGLFLLLKSSALLCVYTRSIADPERLTYGYAADTRNRDNDPNPVCRFTMAIFSLDDHERDNG